MKRIATVLFALIAGAPAMADVSFPEGCVPIANVLKTNCTATIVMRCGSGFTEDTYTNGTRVDRHIFGHGWDLRGYVSEANSFTASIDTTSGHGMTLEELAETGTATGKRKGTFKTRVVRDRPIGVENTFTLSDETVTLSGVEMRKGVAKRLFIVNPNNRDLDSVWEIEIFVSKEKNLFFEGRSTQRMMGRVGMREQDPKEIVFPGDDGFGSVTSPYGCGEQ
ncbi:hypothetical protein KO498_00680 [Lentibacter algarum]|uniref:hypothetical protein n=1 Tax=Lentibacter algarum TaxID=576131 RepID=UPI001C065F51|nr:hypothetical protein [Lentibacter algarum]MBU2980312.1 hypothetical protein [Lentibacter algarum]